MKAYAETISYQCGDPLFEEGIEDSPDNAGLLKLKETFFVREALTCKDQVEHEFFNTGGVPGRAQFEYICSICGADPDESPLVSDAVLGIAPDGRKLLPICEGCHGGGKLKPRAFGKADQPKAQAARRKSREIAKQGRGQGRGGGRGRGSRGRGRGRGKTGRGRGLASGSEDEGGDSSGEDEVSAGSGRAAKRRRRAVVSSDSSAAEAGEEGEGSGSSPPISDEDLEEDE